MPGAAKKRPINEIIVTVGSGPKARIFALPKQYAQEVQEFISSRVDQAKLEESIPAWEVLPELADDVRRPAAMLRGARYKAEMTQKELASKLGIRQHHLSEMEHGRRPIGKQMARRLAVALACDYRVFI